jgi:hypothetical protein
LKVLAFYFTFLLSGFFLAEHAAFPLKCANEAQRPVVRKLALRVAPDHQIKAERTTSFLYGVLI